MKKPKVIYVSWSIRSLDRALLDEMRLMALRQRRSIGVIANRAIEHGLRILKSRELEFARRERGNGKAQAH